MKVLITGGAGFIGSAMVRSLIHDEKLEIMNIDSLSYAGNLKNIANASNCPNYSFQKIDIRDQKKVFQIFDNFLPDTIIHFAACSHVDNSIKSPSDFISTNILGTFNLLEASRKILNLKSSKDSFRFHHISTDEVYGDLGDTEKMFSENDSYDPSSPYSSSKASSDHLVRSWGRTYGIPYTISNCSNNFGPYQHREKLIPATIINALRGRNIPLYGDGMQMRDWLHVDDHVDAIRLIAFGNVENETFNIGSRNVLRNKEVVNIICEILNEQNVTNPINTKDFTKLINYISDRPGHDFRYAIDSSKIEDTFKWRAKKSFSEALENTVKWYINNENWWKN